MTDRAGGDGLLPCPFCGSPARYDGMKCAVRCSNDIRCSITGPSTYDREKAILRWNTRASPPSGNAEKKEAIKAAIERHVGVSRDLTYGEDVLLGVDKAADAILSLVRAAPPQPALDALREALDREEKYLLGLFPADCDIMPGDVQGSFHSLRSALSTPLPSGEHPNAERARE